MLFSYYYILIASRYTRTAFRYIDAYRKGLNAAQAVFATKKYHGHRTLPGSILADLDKLGFVGQQQDTDS